MYKVDPNCHKNMIGLQNVAVICPYHLLHQLYITCEYVYCNKHVIFTCLCLRVRPTFTVEDHCFYTKQDAFSTIC